MEICGTKYSKGMVVAAYMENDVPVFGKIFDFIIIPSGECLFALKPLVPVRFDEHYHAYEVHEQTSTTLLYEQHELLDFHPLSLVKSFKPNSSSYISLKYHLYNT